MKMTKCYIVTSGEYSDYRIWAVFSAERAAQDYAKDVGWGSRVETYRVDIPRSELGGAHVVVVDQEGTVRDSRYGIYNLPSTPAERRREIVVWTYKLARLRNEKIRQKHFLVNEFIGYGLTEEHARRSAEELRRATLSVEGRQVDQREMAQRLQAEEDAAQWPLK